jgi:hypothetical protein
MAKTSLPNYVGRIMPVYVFRVYDMSRVNGICLFQIELGEFALSELDD